MPISFRNIAVATIAIFALAAVPKQAFATPPSGYTLEWSDEFNEGVGTAPSSAYWGYDTGAGGWGNNELETYTTSLANSQLIADPNAEDGCALQITAIDKNGGVGTAGRYTSARLLTSGKVIPEYGYIEARVQMPFGDGIWPAFWTLGQDINTVSWPACGEQDIMENIGNQSWWGENAGSLHAPNYNSTADYFLPSGEYFWQGYHKFAELWTPTSITFLVDDVPYETQTPNDVGGGTWEWTANPAFILLNVAVGGNFPGNPDSSTTFPQTMNVDYVKVYTSPFNGPHNIPGVVQAEDFDNGGQLISFNSTTTANQGGQYRPELGVGIEATNGGGYDVGWTAAGQWMKYAVNVQSTGTYNVAIRASSSQTGGGSFHIEDENGNNLTGSISVPDTNSYQTWTIVNATAQLTAGAHVLRLVEDTGGYNLDYIAFTSSSGAFNGPHSLPGVVQAEDYDQGGEGVGFHSTTTASNPAGVYRSDPITVEQCGEGGYDVSSTAAGQWLKYTVNVSTAGLYNVAIHAASGSSTGGTLHVVDENGNNLTGSVNIPNTGGVQNWTAVDAIVNLTQGAHTLQVVEDTGGFSLDYLSFTTAFDGPQYLPASIAVANYDLGGSGIGYNMASPFSPGTSNYRGSDAVGIENGSLGADVGWTQAGQWTDHTVFVYYTGTYNATFTVASGASGGSFHLTDENGNNLTGSVSVPGTGGWQNWQTVTATVSLTAGGHVLQLDQDSGGYNIYQMTFALATPPTVSSVGLNPTSVASTTSSTATVTLGSAAVASIGPDGQTVLGGEAVQVSSDNAAATIGTGTFTSDGSTYVLVPTGQTSAAFTVNTTDITSTPITANISASIDGSTLSTALTITDTTPPTTTKSTTGNSNGTTTVTLSATDPDNTSNQITTYYTIDGGAQQTYSAPFTVTGPGSHTLVYWSVDAPGNTETAHTTTVNVAASVVFVKSDTSTLGTWKGVYGSDGYNVIADTSATEPNYPAYAVVSPTGNSPHTWVASTTVTQALQWAAAGSTNRIAACWYAATSQTINVNLTDRKVHQIALYLLDYDNSGRGEKVAIADAGSGAVLNTQTLTSFKSGVYEVWNITGNVNITITTTAGPNNVISGLFFGSAPVAPTGLTATGGNGQVALSWTAASGAASYNIYRGTSAGGEGSTPIKAGVTASTYTDTTVTNGTTYYYEVTAVNSVGEGSQSNEASASPHVTIPQAPTGVTATTSNAKVTLNWTATTGATSYNLYRGNSAGGEGATVYATNLTGTTFGDTPLTNGTTYYYEVTAVNSAGESPRSSEVSGTPSATAATATFLKSDSTTSGTWKGVYGSDGYNVIADTSATEPNYPAYATVSPTGNNPHTWVASTTVTPALQWAAAGSTNRIAACWYAATSQTINVNLTDGKTHQIALYLLDYDNSGRGESVSIVDAGTGSVLDTETASAFTKGVYEVWSISGNVTITITTTAGPNSVVSGLFFDAAPAPPAPPTNLIATGVNGQVSLSWGASAGAGGYNVYRGITSGGEGVTPIKVGQQGTTYTDATVTNGTTYYYEVTAQKVPGGESAKSNEASATPQVTAPAPPTGLSASAGNTQSILNWTASSGATSYNVYQGTSAGGENSTPVGSVTSGTTYTATGLTNGTKYYFTVAAVNTAGTSGMSNEASATPATGPSSTATFVKSDTTTSGTWKGVYGGDGYNVINDTSATEPNYPAYATVSATGNTAFTWAASTTNTPALQWAATSSTNRIAACWYAATSETIDVNLTDGQTHQVALYLLDYDNSGRADGISIADAGTGTVLNTQSVSSFKNGVYEVWRISGHVKITITKSGFANAVISGLFFDALPPAPSAPTNVTATAGSGQATLSWTASSGAASYNVYEGTTSGGEGSTPVTTGVTGTSTTITGLTNGTKYYFTVAAVNSTGTSGPSNEASATLPSSTAAFVKSDTSTSGSWKGVYGADGYNIINDTSATEPNYPAYATVSPSGNTAFTWAASTTVTPALQWAATGSTNRIAACWYSAAGETIDINLTDGQSHQVALYLLDYDNSGRVDGVSIADASTGTVLNTQTVSSFKNGVYEVWNITGHVKITLTKNGGANAVVSGIFFK